MSEFLVGGYGADLGGTATGIGRARSHPDGAFEFLGVVAEVPSPSWLTVDGVRVFAALEGSGEVAEFSSATDALELRGRASSGGVDPCHLAVTHDSLVIANYQTGNVTVHDLALDSGEPRQSLPGSGSGPLAAQRGPHAHGVLLLGDHVLTADLGADRILVHEWHAGELVRTDELQLEPGTGPRDLLALPDGRVAVLAEWSCELLLLEPMGATFEVVQILALPGATAGDDQAAGLGLSVDGRHLFAGVRGSDRIATIGLDADAAYPVGWASSGGHWPRHLIVDGPFLHVANQLSNSVATFAIGVDGGLEHVGVPVAVPSPTCLAAL